MNADKTLFSSTYRQTKVSIDLSALQHNAKIAKQHAPNSSLMAVLKANAYGHGLLECAQALLGIADEFAVASLDDALFLRNNLSNNNTGINALSGFYREEEIAIAANQGISFCVYDHHQLTLITQFFQQRSFDGVLKIWLKVDTGMSRLGFSTESLHDVIKQVDLIKAVQIRGVISHFANADIPEHALNQAQLKTFNDIKKHYTDRKWDWSLANSAAVMGMAQSHQDWIRPGVMLYGSSPLMNESAQSLNCLPVMTFSSELISIRMVQQNESIGYGSQWTADINMTVGVIACGYGDGYPRHIAPETSVLIHGKRTKILGRVSMDLMVIDLTGIDAEIHDEVILWGKGLSIDEIAKSAETIGYELMCGITQRVKKEYVNV